MDSHDAGSNLIFFVIGIALITFFVSWSGRIQPDLRHIPTHGRKSYLFSCIDPFRHTFTCPSILYDALEHPTVFKVPTLHRWLVVITGARLIEELRKIPEENLSSSDTKFEPDAPLFHPGHSLGVEVDDMNRAILCITQNIPFILPSIRDEIVRSFGKCTITTGWVEIDPLDLVLDGIAAVNTRVFTGLSFFQDSALKQLVLTTSRDSLDAKYSFASDIFPQASSSVFGVLQKSWWKRRALCRSYTTLIRQAFTRCSNPKPWETVRSEHTEGDSAYWHLEGVLKGSSSPERLASHMFDLSMAATETISLNLLHALYHLAASPKYASPMRKEAEAITGRDGWGKPSLDRMYKIDSFIKESMRISGAASVSGVRMARTDLTLSDGTCIPSGSVLCMASRARHLDGSVYGETAGLFDGFRFSRAHEANGEEHPNAFARSISSAVIPPRFQLVTTTTDYLAWGYGRHSCPGRFYAAAVMKMMIAHIVMNYDVRFEDGNRPEDIVKGLQRLPNLNTKILMRRR